MQIKQESFLDILGLADTQFVVPVFQRVYSWTKRQCDDLYDDVIEAAETGASHFTGVLLFSADPEAWGDFGRLEIIDGQQRITTMTLLLIALRERLAQDGVSLPAPAGDGSEGSEIAMGPEDITRRLLRATEKDGAPCRLALSHLDRMTMAALVDGAELPEEHSERLVENLDAFRARMAAPGFDAGLLWRGLGRMQVITSLLTGDDNPLLIFESLNSKGMTLSVGDLVRNLLLFAGDEEDRERLYERYWLPMEKEADDLEGFSMDQMVVAFLAAKYCTGDRVRGASDAYAVLKTHLADEYAGSFEPMLEELRGFADRYLTDVTWRRKYDSLAKDWMNDRVMMSVSERRMFGS